MKIPKIGIRLAAALVITAAFASGETVDDMLKRAADLESSGKIAEAVLEGRRSGNGAENIRILQKSPVPKKSVEKDLLFRGVICPHRRTGQRRRKE